MGLDKTDSGILRYLTADARLSARQLAIKLDVSTATIISRIKRLEKQGLIKGYAARLDHEKLGYLLTAVIEITGKNTTVIEKEVAKFRNVCAVYGVTGSTDAIIIAKFQSRDQLGEFVKKVGSINNVDKTITHVVLDTRKEDFRL